MPLPGEEYLSPATKTIRVRIWKDVIRAIRNPSFVSADRADYPSLGDEVLGLELRGESKAYPVKMLAWNHIANDSIGGIDIAVTYCSLCRTGIVFDARKEQGRHVFGIAGIDLRGNNMLMYDEESLSLWPQALAECLWGKYYGTKLQMIPSLYTTWRVWKRLHSDTVVLSRETGFDYDYAQFPTATMIGEFSEPWDEFERSDNLAIPIPNLDRRLHPKEQVIGVEIDGVARAYPIKELENALAINDAIGATRAAVLYHDGTAAVYDRKLEGMVLEFDKMGDYFCDRASNSKWTIDGKAVDGPLKGKQLDRFAYVKNFWFGWSTAHPSTSIFSSS